MGHIYRVTGTVAMKPTTIVQDCAEFVREEGCPCMQDIWCTNLYTKCGTGATSPGAENRQRRSGLSGNPCRQLTELAAGVLQISGRSGLATSTGSRETGTERPSYAYLSQELLKEAQGSKGGTRLARGTRQRFTEDPPDETEEQLVIPGCAFHGSRASAATCHRLQAKPGPKFPSEPDAISVSGRPMGNPHLEGGNGI
ncbi:uncharacterized protein An08g07860 [Aspergillus niger]|uniref:Contig An08c0210, genomic contig n=2 Tax=Aspergillus niger TaxID=5061 RepID=A2QS07_ASPNC|nr:uncharacterized protein An08g07860 [Aspergillus niger]CAK45679.1 unnamed protein product [Aspergillus niger]